jgi:hypothetical protein
MLAPTKHAVELPSLRAVTPVGADVGGDTRQNLVLHRRVLEALAGGHPWSADELVACIYEELFLMPPHDPALGLDVPDPFLDPAFVV